MSSANLAGGDGEPTADQVEQRGLAGAVRTDQGMPLAGGNVEVDAANDLGLAKILGDLEPATAPARSSACSMLPSPSGDVGQGVPDAFERDRFAPQPDAAARQGNTSEISHGVTAVDVDRGAEQHETLALRLRRW